MIKLLKSIRDGTIIGIRRLCEKKKGLFRMLCVVAVVNPILWACDYHLSYMPILKEDVSSPLMQVRKADDASEMVIGIDALIDGMFMHGMNEGHATMQNRTDEYSYEEIYTDVKGLKMKAERTAKLDKGSELYALRMLDQSIISRNLDICLPEYAWRHHRFWFWYTEILFIICLLFVVWRRHKEYWRY